MSLQLQQDFRNLQWPFGGRGKTDDVPAPKGKVCAKISEIVSLADKNAGEYSFGGQADTLPVSPELFVSSVGIISLPLVKEQAEKLIAECKKSPYGHNMDTKMDESVRKSWQLEPDQVEIKNPSWEAGLDKLTEIIANRLGYKRVPLQCKLYKVLVYGERGHFLKHQDTEKEDGMIATLVVQPPSTHEGGDLVVYRGGKVEHRHDFGKADGTAACFPHFAVHYADAEHALEKVTKGFRLVMVYSICLPATMHQLRKDSTLNISDDLGDAISQMENESFALFLSHEYTKKSIENLGCGAFKGVDRDRFKALEEANSRVPDDKKLRFFIAKLSFKIYSLLSDESLSSRNHTQALHWYTTSGEDLGHWKDKNLRKENVLNLVSAELAIEDLASCKPVSGAALRTFFDAASTQYGWDEQASQKRGAKVSVRFCRSFFDLLVETKDLELAKLFLGKFCPKLGKKRGNESLIGGFVKIVSKFPWDDVGEALLYVLDTSYRGFYYGDSAVELLLRVAAGLNDGVPRQTLIAKAFEKIKTEDMVLHSSEAAEVLWQHASSPGESQLFEMVVNKLEQMTPSELGPFGNVLAQHGSNFDSTSEQFTVLSTIAAKRVEWLKDEIEKLEKLSKTFSWEMPYAQDSGYEEIEDFLHGPQQSVTVKGERSDDTFSGLAAAKLFASYFDRGYFPGSSCVAKAARGDEGAFVTITKTREWFDNSQENLVRYAKEMADLSEVFKGPMNTSSTK